METKRKNNGNNRCNTKFTAIVWILDGLIQKLEIMMTPGMRLAMGKVEIITNSSAKTKACFCKLLSWEKIKFKYIYIYIFIYISLYISISAFMVVEAWCSTDKMTVGCTKLCQITCSSHIMYITAHEGQR